MFPETTSWKDYILDSRELLDQFVEGQKVLRFIDRKRRRQMPTFTIWIRRVAKNFSKLYFASINAT